MPTEDRNLPVGNSETRADEPAGVTYSMSGGLVGLLASLKISVAFSSYQSGKFYLLGRNPEGGLMVNEQFFRQAMGIHVSGGTIYLATLSEIVRLENVLEPNQRINDTFDACFVPRTAHVTGALDAHDLGIDRDGRILFVNTRFNCLSTISERHSFRPVWTPPFVSRIVDEDRCHLNGMAMRDGRPAFVTAVSRSDTIDGWRDRRADGGVVVDVETGRIVCQGLSMPHSPRWYRGRLWLLNSGTGELGSIIPTVGDSQGRFEPLAFCPGFLRGLSFHGHYAFVGLSKPRYQRFEGLALDERLRVADSEPWCGVQVIDLDTGACVEWFRIDGAVAELYDIDVLPGVTCPMSLGFGSEELMNLVTVDVEDKERPVSP
ncbi:TIGR03032 family protein [uncultured Roseibium sp.]|uniref:TIGR03032 family protein n=1 Tax=uncultured Roseibium sp. TaxID=1936171 RepID=UPI0026182086|nr:TIGR03032 family protein [uncultured Roseibium sp.]